MLRHMPPCPASCSSHRPIALAGPRRAGTLPGAAPGSSMAPRAAASSDASGEEELPYALRGLKLDENGELVDEKGKAINSMGATRFDVTVRAMRGELDPPAWEGPKMSPEDEIALLGCTAAANTERSAGILLQSLFQFPTEYMFQVVGQPSKQEGCSKDQFIADMVSLVERVCQSEQAGVEVAERMGGKFVSLKITCTVRAPEIISQVFASLEGDQRIKMKF